jgi:hypothetical protein
MGYYGQSAYRGDYYGGGRAIGDYYRMSLGDPGFFDFIGGIAKTVGGAIGGVAQLAAPLLPGPFGGIARAVGGLLGPGPPAPTPPALIPPPWAATAPGTGSTAAMIPASPFQAAFTGPGGRPPMLMGPAPFRGGGGGGSGGAGISRKNGGVTTQLVQDVHTGRFHVAHCPAGHGGVPTRTVFRRVASWEVRCRKHMNPLNPHALRKALRRAHGFTRLVSKTLRFTKPHHKVGGFKMIGGKKKK